MSDLSRLHVAAALLLIAPLLHAGEAGTVPDLLTSVTPVAEPMWVSVDAALSADHVLNDGILGPYAARLRDLAQTDARSKALARPLAEEEDVCHVFVGDPVCQLPPPPTPGVTGKPANVRQEEASYDGDALDGMSAKSGAIVAGRVVAIKAGFLWGRPGSLLALKSKSLKGDDYTDAYVFYPFAHIRTAEGMVCGGPMTDPPRLNERVLIFQIGDPFRTADGRAIFFVDIPRDVVYERHPGLQVPAGLRGRFPRNVTFDAIVNETARSVIRMAPRRSETSLH